MNSLYILTSVFILSSMKEDFGIVFVKVMLWRLLVIAFDSSSILELVRDEEKGFLVETGSTMSLVRAINHLLEEKSMCKSLGEVEHQQATLV